MPFTFAHPALVIPFLKKKPGYFSATGLIFGSITPDFESFITFNDRKLYSHSWLGVFWYDLPLCIVATFLFHYLVKDIALLLSPGTLRKKMPELAEPWLKLFKTRWTIILPSMLLGIFTHLLWDAFTHFDLLHPHGLDSGAYVATVARNTIPQYVSSILGSGICIYFIYKMPKVANSKRIDRLNGTALVTYFLTIIVVTISVVVYQNEHLHYPPGFMSLLSFSISGIIVSLVGLALLHQFFLRFARKLILKEQS